MYPTLPLPTLQSRRVFSVQVRDYVDLCITRLADLKAQEEASTCKKAETGHDRTPGVGESINRETGHVDGDCGDPNTREVNNKGVDFTAYVSRSFTERCRNGRAY